MIKYTNVSFKKMRFAASIFNEEDANPGMVAETIYNMPEMVNPADQTPGTSKFLGLPGQVPPAEYEDNYYEKPNDMMQPLQMAPVYPERDLLVDNPMEGARMAQLTPSMMDELVRDEDEQELLDLGGIIPRSLDYDMGIIKTRPGTPQYYYERARPGGPF